MGLVLDELDENEENVVHDSNVKIVYDGRLKNFFDHKRSITIDHKNDKYGSGFLIMGGSHC